MNTITRIEPLKRNRKRFKIYFDDGQIFSLDEELVVRYHLKPGIMADATRLSEWIAEDDERRAFNMAIRYLGYRARSQSEIEKYLENKGFDSPTVSRTIEKLQGYGYVDDLSFAKAWVKHRMSGNPMGKPMIRQELKIKGIDDHTIIKALGLVNEQEEEEAAMRLAQKYRKRYIKLNDRELFQKIGQAMARRGFEWDVIKRVCRKLEN